MIKLFWRSVIEKWREDVGYDQYPMRDHHMTHVGVACYAFIICLVCGLTPEESAWVVMALGLIVEIAGVLSGESLRNAIWDLTQYWFFSPLVLFYYGDWILGGLWFLVLVTTYFYTLLRAR